MVSSWNLLNVFKLFSYINNSKTIEIGKRNSGTSWTQNLATSVFELPTSYSTTQSNCGRNTNSLIRITSAKVTETMKVIRSYKEEVIDGSKENSGSDWHQIKTETHLWGSHEGAWRSIAWLLLISESRKKHSRRGPVMLCRFVIHHNEAN